MKLNGPKYPHTGYTPYEEFFSRRRQPGRPFISALNMHRRNRGGYG